MLLGPALDGLLRLHHVRQDIRFAREQLQLHPPHNASAQGRCQCSLKDRQRFVWSSEQQTIESVRAEQVHQGSHGALGVAAYVILAMARETGLLQPKPTTCGLLTGHRVGNRLSTLDTAQENGEQAGALTIEEDNGNALVLVQHRFKWDDDRALVPGHAFERRPWQGHDDGLVECGASKQGQARAVGCELVDQIAFDPAGRGLEGIRLARRQRRPDRLATVPVRQQVCLARHTRWRGVEEDRQHVLAGWRVSHRPIALGSSTTIASDRRVVVVIGWQRSLRPWSLRLREVVVT